MKQSNSSRATGDEPVNAVIVGNVCETLPPETHNPFLWIHELPALLQKLRHYHDQLNTQLGLHLLLTGVRTGELRLAMTE
ncbi:hypothetical protein [Brenneria populi]|uniref:hypothetical protein n=1 Tax=Brenneria populi TaxID=1505588 RepID=UPI003D9A84A8